MEPLETYLVELRNIRASGAAVPETSGYGALANLLNEVGHKLKPRVRCLINLANTGAGIPDGGLFTANQFDKAQAVEPLTGQMPARGALEVKPVTDDAHKVVADEQVTRYLEKYRQVLVSNYREFVLVGYDADGARTALESYSLAASEAQFWALAAQPRKGAADHGERLTEFLKRAMLRQTQIVAPQELAWFLASYAREARARAEERDLPNWSTTRTALEEALGMSFEGEKGEHFFRSTLVQTLFYGLFAAWVFWAEHHEPTDSEARFRWREAAGLLHIPILQKLFYDFSQPGPLGALRIDEVLDWAAEALNRVDRAGFFATFEQSHAVQYFYEPFLEAFDPEMRKQLGVWYTPPEIVEYMVARVDQVLRSELGIADGLADPSVVVLDPCCGTGAYLVEVLNRIAKTVSEKGDDALLAHDLKQAAMSRIYGFEILPAPFVISHLQIGMLLHRLGAPFDDDSNERAGVYLTNALTGWDPPTSPKQHLLFTEMEEERDKAQAVKQHAPILVILGNPPYNGFAGVSPDEEAGLVEPYKEGLASKWGVKKFNLDDLYVRFIRLAEQRIGETAERGVVCFISNFSYLSGASFVAMREKLLREFDHLWFDNLNGDSRETGKLTPDGASDPSVFSTGLSREGIRVGTAIGLLVRRNERVLASDVRYRQFWGTAKRQELLDSLRHSTDDLGGSYETVVPSSDNRFSFRPLNQSADYLSWPPITEIAAEPSSNGLMEKRGGALFDIDKAKLAERMHVYFDENASWDAVSVAVPTLARNAARFVAVDARKKVLSEGAFDETALLPYTLLPFDNRWCYYSRTRPLWNEPRPRLRAQVWPGNAFVVSRVAASKTPEGSPMFFTRCLSDDHLLAPDAACFPIRVRDAAAGNPHQTTLNTEVEGQAVYNLSARARQYLDGVLPEEDRGSSEMLWMHTLSLGYSPAYLAENAAGIRRDWPRIPLPATADALLASAELGRRIAALLDVEAPVDGVSTGQIRFELRPIGSIAKADGGQIDPATGDLAVTAGWGHAGQGGICMPAKGRLIERAYSEAELAGLREGMATLGLNYEQLMACLGGTCVDVYLNERAYWRCVPRRVWSYTIGGYQVMKKWLSYRERPLLGRDLKADEARYVTEMARRIAALLLLEPALDENYARVKADVYPWPGGSS
jgi:hypothetical protein